jgi:hypothetical protein
MSAIAPVKSLTFTSSTKKLRVKLYYKKAARKLLVKLTPGVNRTRSTQDETLKKINQ